MKSVGFHLCMVVATFALHSCGQSIDGLRFYKAASKQFAIDNSSLQLFARGPTWDSSNPSFTSLGNLNTIPRTYVRFYGLPTLDGGLQGFVDTSANDYGFGLSVQYSHSDSSSPVFSSWAGEEINANSKEFKAFMMYAHLSSAYLAVQDFDGFTPVANSYNLVGVAAEPGSFFDVGFSYLNENVITFYQHNQDTEYENLNLVDEADAVYHEFAHYIQRVYNYDVISEPISNWEEGFVQNPDMDAIIEGTADFFAAAMTQNGSILQYLSNNINSYSGSSAYRFGRYSRDILSALAFPEHYTYNLYMDGRVVANAIYQLSQLYSTCSNFDREDHWMLAFEASMEAFSVATATTTFQAYFEALIAAAVTQFSAASCATNPQNALETLYREYNVGLGDDENDIRVGIKPAFISEDKASGLLTVSTVAEETGNVLVGEAFDFVPFMSSSGFSNTDNDLSECEIVIAMPKFTNNTNNVPVGTVGETDLYNIYFHIAEGTDVLLAQPINYTGGGVIDALSSSNWKSWGIVEPGLSGVNYVEDSGSVALEWLTPSFGLSFSKPATMSTVPVNYGYLLAPRSGAASGQVEITWEVIFEPRRSSTTATRTSTTFTQSITVAEDNDGFCL